MNTTNTDVSQTQLQVAAAVKPKSRRLSTWRSSKRIRTLQIRMPRNHSSMSLALRSQSRVDPVHDEAVKGYEHYNTNASQTQLH
eukprot:3967981-Pleurochrysis_carterae.AAC.1